MNAHRERRPPLPSGPAPPVSVARTVKRQSRESAMKPTIGPPYPVTINEFGDATVALTLAFAETVQDQLRRHGHRSKLTAGKGNAISTLNFGRDADLTSIQQLIDSFSKPSPRTESGRPSSDWRHAYGEE